MDFSFLSEIGLTQNEIKIYGAVLKLGSVPSGRIVYETGLHRSRVHEGLHRLIEKGMISFVKKGSTSFFEATSSEKVLDVLEEEKEKIDEKIKRIEPMISEMNRLRETKPTAEAYILQGIEGYKAMRRDVFKSGAKDLLLLGAIAVDDKALPTFFEKWYKERARKGIKMRVLYKAEARDRLLSASPYVDKRRFLPDEFSNPTVINIYGDRVVNVLWKGKYPLCFVMVNKDIADAYRKYFELFWKASKK